MICETNSAVMAQHDAPQRISSLKVSSNAAFVDFEAFQCACSPNGFLDIVAFQSVMNVCLHCAGWAILPNRSLL